MEDDVHHLVLAPFQEIVEKAKAALANAADSDLTNLDGMFRAAQGLIRRGERALRKLEPLCKKQWEEYSTNFVVALKENDEIAGFREELNDLLWDFDSFVEVDDFNAGEYSKLQALSSKAAKRIYEMLVRMKLEPVPIAFNSLDSAGISRTTLLAGHSFVSETQVVPTERPPTIDEECPGPQPAQGSVGRTPTTASLMTAQAEPDPDYEESDPEPFRHQRPDSPPDIDNWQNGCEKSCRPPLHYRRKFTAASFDDHLKQFGNIQDGKHHLC